MPILLVLLLTLTQMYSLIMNNEGKKYVTLSRFFLVILETCECPMGARKEAHTQTDK